MTLRVSKYYKYLRVHVCKVIVALLDCVNDAGKERYLATFLLLDLSRGGADHKIKIRSQINAIDWQNL